MPQRGTGAPRRVRRRVRGPLRFVRGQGPGPAIHQGAAAVGRHHGCTSENGARKNILLGFIYQYVAFPALVWGLGISGGSGVSFCFVCFVLPSGSMLYILSSPFREVHESYTSYKTPQSCETRPCVLSNNATLLPCDLYIFYDIYLGHIDCARTYIYS